MSRRRFGPPPRPLRPPGKSIQMLLVIGASAPVFFAFQNFGSPPTGLHAQTIPKSEVRANLSRKAWALQAKDENRRALRLIATQISELFPKGQLSSESLAKTFQARDFIESTSADQLMSGDPIPACQWLQEAFRVAHSRTSPERRCKSKVIDLTLEVNDDCRLQAMIEECSQIPPLPYPSLFETWRICGHSSCENQIAKDLATYLRFFKASNDPTWILDRLIPMSGQALSQTDGPFALQPLLEYAKLIFETPGIADIKTSQGLTLRQKAIEFVLAFDRLRKTEFQGLHDLRSPIYKPSVNNVSRFHGLLVRSQIQWLMEDLGFRENFKAVRQFARVLKGEIFTRENFNLGYTPEVFAFIQACEAAGLEFNMEDVGRLKPTMERNLKNSPWRTQPFYYSLHLSILGEPSE